MPKECNFIIIELVYSEFIPLIIPMAIRISTILILWTIVAFPLWAYSTKNVHVIVIDGARYSETFGDPTHQFIPNIWNKLRPQGTLYTRFYNDSVTYTVPGHCSIVSGVWNNVPNDASAVITSPTVFEYFRKELHAPPSDNYVILGKEKLHCLAASAHPDYGPAFGASVRFCVSPYEDTLTWQNIKAVFTTHHPRLTITNLASVDVCGHNGIWEEYVRSIRVADSITNETWNLIQSDPVYKDQTTLIVTNDHGRHDGDAWSGHGCGCDGCRHIMLLVIGPDIEAGKVDTVHRTLIDIAPTVGELMDFSTPLCNGTPIIPVRPPATPALASPGHDTVHQLLTVSLRWTPVPRAQRYQVQVSTDSQFMHTVTDDPLLTWNSTTAGPLSIKTKYYWRVRSINQGGTSSWSQTWRFSTIPTLPPIVLLNAPENAATVSKDSIQFSWNATSFETDRYQLEIALDSPMTAIVHQDSQITVNSQTHYFFQNKGIFFWRVKAHYTFGWADWSAIRCFKIEIPKVSPLPEKFNFAFEKGRKRGLPIVLGYALPKASNVSINMYTISGQRIGTFLNTWQTPDFYHISIPTQTLSRGFYLLDFEALPFKSTKLFFLN
jgi:hypothetical protein